MTNSWNGGARSGKGANAQRRGLAATTITSTSMPTTTSITTTLVVE